MTQMFISPRPSRTRLSLRKALRSFVPCLVLVLTALLSLAALAPAQAQWAPCDPNGNLLSPGNPGLNADGSATLMGTGPMPQASNTYPMSASMGAFWLSAYSPNASNRLRRASPRPVPAPAGRQLRCRQQRALL